MENSNETPALDNPTVFVVREANEWIADAARRPNPRQLWKELWYEGEVTCLFADTNVGKSIYAIQIANEIAKTERVVYFDFEMSDKQFQLRYTDDEGTLFRFNEGFMRAEYSRNAAAITDIDDVIEQIVLAARTADAKKVVLDNISWICNRSESGDAAGLLMQRLVEVKNRYGLSLLVLAHTPKRNTATPLNQNSLAGSKKLANFFDAIFAIGINAKDTPSGRYIKQIKVRTGELKYGGDNVIVCRLVKEGNSLHFEETGFGIERALLDEPSPDDILRKQKREEILQRLQEGESIRSVAKDMQISTRTVIKYRRDSEGQ